MRLMYLDPGMQNDVGHHANYARAILNEATRRQIQVDLFGWHGVTAALQAELGAIPFFRWYTYTVGYQNNPISGWLMNFEQGWRVLLEDLRKLPTPSPDDIIFIPSLWPSWLMAVVQWISNIPADRRPTVVGEFASECGLQPAPRRDGPPQYAVPDPRTDPRATLYHYAAALLDDDVRQRFTLCTFERAVSTLFQTLLDVEIASLPWPIAGPTAIQSRANRRPITAAFLGFQRLDKGYALVPQIVQQLLRDRTCRKVGVRLLIHNARPDECPEIHAAVRALVRPQVQLDESPVDGPRWQALLDKTDLMICPYDPKRYAAAHSGLTTECLANGIPMILPADTVLSAIAARFNVGTCFDQWTAASVSAATVKAIDRFDTLAERSYHAAGEWKKANGPAAFFEALLQLTRR